MIIVILAFVCTIVLCVFIAFESFKPKTDEQIRQQIEEELKRMIEGKD